VDQAAERPNPFGETGEVVVMNPGRAAGGLLRPAGPVDPEIFVLSVQHADGRPLAVFANYGLHYIGGIPGGNVSADYFGVFAERMKELLAAERQEPAFVAAMFNGASGDVNAIDFNAPEASSPPFERMTRVARAVADEALRVYRGIEHRAEISLRMREVELQLAVRRPDARRIEWARPLVASGEAKLAAGRPLTRPEVYARETMHLQNYPATVPVKIQAIRVGELGIAAAPNEVFAETGLAVKAGSPFKDTFVIGLANAYYGYLPTPQQHAWGGYETWAARSSALEVQAEPKIRAAMIEGLRELAKR
jgi:neutral ceramidase